MKGFIMPDKKYPIITADNRKTKPWRNQIALAATKAMQGHSPTFAPVHVHCYFCFVRPKTLNKSITQKTTRPDVDKLLRAVLDALTGIVYVDDSQVTAILGTKEFGPEPGVVIEVSV
jgi:crossover junction endodeoxyribonuclease RusA